MQPVLFTANIEDIYFFVKKKIKLFTKYYIFNNIIYLPNAILMVT